jgi:cytoskeletal protein CcmA (bactofilin family)
LRLIAEMGTPDLSTLQSANPDTKIRLVAMGENLWKVRMLFPREKAMQIPEQLRLIKSQLANSFGVPDFRLEYIGLYSKRVTSAGILVEMQIEKQILPTGAMRVRFLPMTAADGSEFSDMQVSVDMFPYDEYEHAISLKSVEEKLKAEGVDGSTVDWHKLHALAAECLQKQIPIFDQVVAQGVLPDVGIASTLYYKWFPQSEAPSASAWMGLRLVDGGEEIVELSIPVSGVHAGKNVFGKELSPRRGITTRLVNGNGVSISSTGRKLTAREMGILVLKRNFHDRRQKDSPRETPMTLEAEVISLRSILSENAQNKRWEESLYVNGSLDENASLVVNGDCVVSGDIRNGCEVQVSGSLRVYGEVGEADLAVGKHLCVHGKMHGTIIQAGLVVQLIDQAIDCTIFAREILADHLIGGTAEAYAPVASNNDLIKVNREKFLQEQRAAGEDALATLRRQITRLYEIFGSEIVHQVTSDSLQIHLLRWLRQQKSNGIKPYSHPQVQEFRTLLELAPLLRLQISSIAGELRATNSDRK